MKIIRDFIQFHANIDGTGINVNEENRDKRTNKNRPHCKNLHLITIINSYLSVCGN